MSISAAAASTAALAAVVVPGAPDAAAPSPATARAVSAVSAAYGTGESGAEGGRDALPQEMTTAVQELRDVLRTTPFGLQFEIDDVTHKVITKVVDRDTGEVIRQLPSEEMVRIAHAMNKLQGLLVRQSA
ncbi:flagellar protein FlaG [Cupriavidus pauculus]|jgi:flagellar protein FlaG|uniref:flagellar protein FlaG n=1 Tax=Cupriavidus pauculus TaxID=82633 RepID=UPI0030F72CBD